MLLGMRAGDPDEDVLGAWLAKESARDLYLTDNPADAQTLLDKAFEGCRTDWVGRSDPSATPSPGGAARS